MPLVSAANLRHAFGDDIVLDGCSLSVERGERIGIVGRNGSGKSTFLRAIGGLLAPDEGRIDVQRGARVGYLHQDPDLDPGDTLREAAGRAFAHLHTLHAELEQVFEHMGEAEGDDLDRLMKQQTQLEGDIERAGGYEIDHRVDATLHGLDFADEQFGVRVRDLSGGQKARLALAKLLLESPDVLLLDEPTNHLDLDGRVWLEAFLREDFPGAVVIISHDRYLLDGCVDRIVEVEHGRLIDYPGNYTAFRKLRAERREAQRRAHEKQQTQFKREEAFIRKFKAGQRAKQARGRESRLERARELTIERPMELDELTVRLPKAERTGEIVAKANSVGKSYPTETEGVEKVLFRGLDLTVSRGERWGIIGPNGAGKSTLVHCLLGEQQLDSGTVKIGSNVKVGHFSQLDDDIRPDLNVYRFLQHRVTKLTEPDGEPVRLSEQQSRDLAGAFLFTGREQEREMQVLSGGEKARARLAALMACAKNVLVLDEPTNHLDLSSAERLEDALRTREKGGTFDGTLILISHDRALIDACCDRLLVLDGKGGVREHLGNYSDYRQWQEDRARERADRERAGAQRKASQPASKPAASKSQDDQPKSKLGWMPLERIEEAMGKLTTRIGELDHELNDADVWLDHERANKLTDERDTLKAELAEYESEWLRKSV